MKKLTLLSLALAGLLAVPALSLAEDAVPPKPPGGTDAPPATSRLEHVRKDAVPVALVAMAPVAWIPPPA